MIIKAKNGYALKANANLLGQLGNVLEHLMSNGWYATSYLLYHLLPIPTVS